MEEVLTQKLGSHKVKKEWSLMSLQWFVSGPGVNEMKEKGPRN